MNKLKHIAATMAFAILATFVQAQTTTNTEVDVMRSNGKIYVVMAVVITILVGLFLYLINLDRKIAKLEKDEA